MQKTVLLTGGSGTIGRRLTQLLQERGYRVSWLSRSSETNSLPANVKLYTWDIAQQTIDPNALQQANYLIHLAGAGISDQRWTDDRKADILNSRVQTTTLLANALKKNPNTLEAYVGASGISYYGTDTGDTPLTETSKAGSDFLAQVARSWERAHEAVAALGIRTVMLRIGIVLSNEGGALPSLAKPIRLGAGAALGSGQQYVSWIHMDDICGLFISAIENPSWRGVYNAVAPGPVTNQTLTKTIAKLLHRPLLLPNVPAFALRIAVGEMADLVLGGNYVLNKRIADETTFQYRYPLLTDALRQLLVSE